MGYFIENQTYDEELNILIDITYNLEKFKIIHEDIKLMINSLINRFAEEFIKN